MARIAHTTAANYATRVWRTPHYCAPVPSRLIERWATNEDEQWVLDPAFGPVVLVEYQEGTGEVHFAGTCLKDHSDAERLRRDILAIRERRGEQVAGTMWIAIDLAFMEAMEADPAAKRRFAEGLYMEGASLGARHRAEGVEPGALWYRPGAARQDARAFCQGYTDGYDERRRPLTAAA